MLSMTGFGESRVGLRHANVTVEIRTVNHRFLDLNCRFPSLFQRYESEVGRLVREKLRRGRVDIALTVSALGGQDSSVIFHAETFDRYVRIAEEAIHRAKVREPSALLSFLPGILARREVVETGADLIVGDDEWEPVKNGVLQAIEALIAMRTVEGAALERELLRLLGEFSSNVERLGGEAVGMPAVFRDRLNTRLEKLAGDAEVDPGRIAQEVAVLADRTDVTEELARLKSHIEQFRQTMRDVESGRKLEFLLQELGREINTTGSKAQSVAISSLVVECKALLEKMREQVLNVE